MTGHVLAILIAALAAVLLWVARDQWRGRRQRLRRQRRRARNRHHQRFWDALLARGRVKRIGVSAERPGD